MLKKYFNKAGGSNILIMYLKNHVFLYAAFLFLILPKNRTGLELLRECVRAKFYNRLMKKNKRLLNNANYELKQLLPVKKLWFCWLQGIESAPKLVKKCFHNCCRYLNEYEITIITSENYTNFSSLPNFIIDKWKKGIISNTHFSDILRNNILINNGGIWIDSTVLITGSIPKDIADSTFFLFQTLKPGRDGKAIPLSSWFISSVPQHPILCCTQDLIYSYWKKNNCLKDYFLYHNFLQMSMEKYNLLSAEIPKYSNEIPHIMLFNLNKKYNEFEFQNILEKSFVHKLTYKLDDSVQSNQNNFYNFLIREIND